jgi:hypothetical protein
MRLRFHTITDAAVDAVDAGAGLFYIAAVPNGSEYPPEHRGSTVLSALLWAECISDMMQPHCSENLTVTDVVCTPVSSQSYTFTSHGEGIKVPGAQEGNPFRLELLLYKKHCPRIDRCLSMALYAGATAVYAGAGLFI